MQTGQSLSLPNCEERAIYVAKGQITIKGTPIPEFAMVILAEAEGVIIEATEESRIALIGGEKMTKRYIEWNFISSRKDRIEKAKQDWLAGNFPKVVGDEDEFIPLPKQLFEFSLGLTGQLKSIRLEKSDAGAYRQIIRIREHAVLADVATALGGEDSAPDPHVLYDASLAACKAITLLMYAKRKKLPLESVDIEIERDNSQESQGVYALNVKLPLNGNLTEHEHQSLAAIADKCPINMLMTSTTTKVNSIYL